MPATAPALCARAPCGAVRAAPQAHATAALRCAAPPAHSAAALRCAATLRAASRARPPRRARLAAPTASLDASLTSAVVSDAAQWPASIYAVLGSSAAAFAGTFFVAPQFKSKFKEATPWEDIYPQLLAQGVPGITPADAARRRGAVLLDVRLPAAAASRAVPKALSAPLYIPIQEYDVFSNIRRVAFAFFGLAGTELNPNWLADVQRAVPNKSAELVVMCEMGGKLENKPGMKFGFQSRSLKALYYLRQAGYRNVRHMTGGVAAWAAAGLPLEEREE